MNEFANTLKNIIEEYGDDVLRNSQKTHAILMDLAQDQVRDRLLARHFVEAGGYTLLKRGETALIIRRLREEFSIEANAAAWITQLFAEALGLEQKPIPLARDAWASSSPLGERPARDAWASSSPLGEAASPSLEQEEADPVFFVGAVCAIGKAHTVAVLQDGTVVAHGRNDFLQCDVDSWQNIVSVAAGDSHTIGLMADGRMVASGRNNFDQCDIGHLEDIAAIYAFGDDTICIDQDGGAMAFGKSELDLSHFEQIRSIAWHPEGIYGIRHDGCVMMSSHGWEEEKWAADLTDVTQIISTYVNGSLALTSAGRIYKMGEPDGYFATLRDITAMVDLTDGFAILRNDGTTRILPYDRNMQRIASEADNWGNITSIFGKYKRLIGLSSDSRLLAACTDPDWIKRNAGWSGSTSPDFLINWYPVGHNLP